MSYRRTLAFFEKLLNKVLDLDPQKHFLLGKLQYQTLGVELYDLDCTCYFIPSDREIKITQHPVVADDVHRLSGSSGMIMAMLISAWPAEFIQKQQIGFTGNIKVLQAYSVFFKAIRPDLLIHLRQHNSNRDNPVINVIDRSISFVQTQVKRRMHALPINLSAYLQEEQGIVPCQEEVEDFFDDIALLKQDYDRLEKKVHQLLDSGLPYSEN